MKRLTAAVACVLVLLSGARAEPAGIPELEHLVRESSAFASVSDDLQRAMQDLNAASSWITSAAETGIDWDEARMHAAAVLDRAAPALDRLEARARDLTFEAGDMPPLYGGIARDRDLMLSNIALARRQLEALAASIEAARQRDAAGIFAAGEGLDRASRAAIEMHDDVVNEWLEKVPADHPDYLLALAMTELTPIWQMQWPEVGADLEDWLSAYAASAGMHDRTGMRIEALGRAAADAVDAFERDLAALLRETGVGSAEIVARDVAREIMHQSAATARLGRLLQERALLLERASAFDDDPALYEAFERYDQDHAQVFLDLSRHFERRFRRLAEGVMP